MTTATPETPITELLGQPAPPRDRPGHVYTRTDRDCLRAAAASLLGLEYNSIPAELDSDEQATISTPSAG